MASKRASLEAYTDTTDLFSLPLEILLNIIVSNNLSWQDLGSLQQSNHFLKDTIQADEEYIYKRLYHQKWGSNAQEIENLVHELAENELKQYLNESYSTYCRVTKKWIRHTIEMPSTLYNLNAITWKEKYRNKLVPNVIAELSCDKTKIHRGDTVTFKLTLENIGKKEETVFLGHGYSLDECSVIQTGKAFFIWKPTVKDPDGYLNNYRYHDSRRYRRGTMMVDFTETLKPGDKETYEIPFLFNASIEPKDRSGQYRRSPARRNYIAHRGTFSLEGKIYHTYVANDKTPDVFPLQVFVRVNTLKERHKMHLNTVYGHCSLVNSNIVNLTMHKQ